MLDTFYPDELLRIPASIGTLIASGLSFFFAYKWRGAAKRYNVSSIRDRGVPTTPACKPN